MTVVAAFDVDGTLTVRDTVVPFLRSIGIGGPVAGLRMLPGLASSGMARDRDRLKAVVSRGVFAGRSVAAVQAAGERHAARIHRQWLRPDTTARLDWHLEQGHRVVFVSASYEFYLVPLSRHLGVHDVIGTRVAHHEGVLTGELVEGNCRAAEKRRRLHRWLDEHHGGRSSVRLWAYGDSAGDAEMLADADHALLVSGTVSRIP